MLYLTRKVGDAVVINDKIEVTVVEVRGRTVKLGFTFPENATVLRKEIHGKIMRENDEVGQAGESVGSDSMDHGKVRIGPVKWDG